MRFTTLQCHHSRELHNIYKPMCICICCFIKPNAHNWCTKKYFARCLLPCSFERNGTQGCGDSNQTGGLRLCLDALKNVRLPCRYYLTPLQSTMDSKRVRCNYVLWVPNFYLRWEFFLFLQKNQSLGIYIETQ